MRGTFADELRHGPYDAIVADPPWHFRSNSKARPGRSAMRHYATMRPEEIAELPVAELTKDDCALFLWITSPQLVIGAHLPVMKAWGFKPSGIAFTWVKLNAKAPELFIVRQDLWMGGGMTTRKNAEFCLLGKRGKSLRVSKSVREIIMDPRREHSRKPVESKIRIEKYLGPTRKVAELFARETYSPRLVWHWDCWADEASKFS